MKLRHLFHQKFPSQIDLIFVEQINEGFSLLLNGADNTDAKVRLLFSQMVSISPKESCEPVCDYLKSSGESSFLGLFYQFRPA